MTQIKYTIVETDLGWMGIAGSRAGLLRTTLPQPSPEAATSLLSMTELNIDATAFGDLPQRLRRYFQGEKVLFPNKLDLRKATPFQVAVWQTTRSIPHGETRSYRWIASEIGRPKTARAVGQVLAHNPFPIVVPCHRVIQSNGSLGGFGGGLEMKKRLLDIESAYP